MTEPQWEPPEELTTPVIRRKVVGRFEWERTLRGRVPAVYMAPALMLATHSNKDGSNAHPGEKRLAADLGVTTRTIRTALTKLDSHGWIKRTHNGGKSGSRRGLADCYQLTIPAPLAVFLDCWGDDGAQWMEWRKDVEGRPWRLRPPEISRTTTGNLTYDHRKSDVDHRKPTSAHQGSNHQGRSHHSASLEAGSTIADAMRLSPTEEEQRFHDDEEPDLDRIEAGLGGFDGYETSTAYGMASNGVHSAAIVNTIQARRRGQ